MAQRKTFPLRLDPEIFEALQRWANADLRSVNAQIEFLLRRSLKQAGLLPERKTLREAKDASDLKEPS